MKPYFQLDGVTIYLGSCVPLPDEPDVPVCDEWLTADVMVTDPPYGLKANLSAGAKGRRGKAGHARVHGEQRWDDTLDIRDAAIERWGDRPAAVFASPKKSETPPFPPREVPLIWDKGELVGMGDLSFPWRVNYELIYIRGGFEGPRTSTAVLRYPLSNMDASRIGHPTPKPVALMENIVERAPKPPAGKTFVIADPFTGSGSTAIACMLLGVPFIGVERTEKYAEIAANRLSQGALDFGGATA